MHPNRVYSYGIANPIRIDAFSGVINESILTRRPSPWLHAAKGGRAGNPDLGAPRPRRCPLMETSPPSLTSDEPPADSGTEAHLHSRPGLTEVPRRNPSLPSDGTRRGFVRPSPLFGHLGPLTGANTSAPTSPAGECLRRESERGLGWRRRHDIKARACHPGHRPRIATTRGSVLSPPPSSRAAVRPAPPPFGRPPSLT